MKRKRQNDPEGVQRNILEVATAEFSREGFGGARVDAIANCTRTSKRMIYYYFGSKDGLYLAALESVYTQLMDEERKIDVDTLHPIQAITELVGLKIDHYTQHPEFIAFLNMENLYRARHLKHSKRIADFKAPFTEIIARVLKRGQRSGLFRRDVDPIDLYISICALGYLYFSNQYTLGVIFGRDLITLSALQHRKTSIADMIISYLTRPNAAAGRAK
jgi:TetR/AcrR family transcriptional regulator